jgi:long-chain acyl-CoA synthetase
MHPPLLTDILRDNIHKYGHRPALFFQDTDLHWKSLTWSEFGSRVENTAKALVNYGIKKGECVAIISQNMPEWTILDYALQFIGAVSVPLYSTASLSQAEFIIRQSGCRLVFAGEQEQYDLMVELYHKTSMPEQIFAFDAGVRLHPDCPGTHFDTFRESGIVKQNAPSLLENKTFADDLCTILYTSGTSGEPKGVMLHNSTFAHCVKIHQQRLSISDQDISLAFLPLSHVFERGWTFVAISTGMSNYYLRNPRTIIDAVKDVKPTILCAVPRFFEKTYAGVQAELTKMSPLKRRIFNWAIRTGNRRTLRVQSNTSLPLWLRIQYALANKLVLEKGRSILGGRIRFMPCAGAALSEQIIRFFHSVGLDIKYGYGLTETTATVSCFTDHGFVFGSVGSVMPDVEVKIGENDEILVKGETVTKGYYMNPEANLEAFTDGWFRTGDAGRVDEKGNIFLTERIKDIIKTSSGKFVAPQGIETLVANNPYIEQIAIVGDNRKYISALVIPSFPNLPIIAKEKGITFTDISDLTKHPEIGAFIMSEIEMEQKSLAQYEKIKRIYLLGNEFSIAGGELTSTLKVKRRVVEQKYSAEIESMYQEN